jgi:hypothetical protein
MTGGYLASQVRQRAIQPILAFRGYIFRDVFPHFTNLDQRADQIGNEHYESSISQPADEDFDGDLSSFAEDAHDQALSWYEMMRSLRQTMLNLLAAGLFHLVEQQLAVLGQDAGFENRQPKSTTLEEVVKWYKSTLRMDLRALPEWQLIDELRLVANTAKHAEGKSSGDLRSLRPELFFDPTLAGMFEGSGLRDYFVNRPVSAPLAGEDLFVTENVLQHYAEGVEKFFREIAAHLDASEDEYY